VHRKYVVAAEIANMSADLLRYKV